MRFSVNVKFFFVGWESILFVVSAHGGSYLWVITPPPYFSHPLERNKCLLKQIQTVKMKNPRKAQSTGQIKYWDLENKTTHYVTVLRDQYVDWDFFLLRPSFLILGILKDLRPGVLKSMKNSSEREIWWNISGETKESQQSKRLQQNTTSLNLSKSSHPTQFYLRFVLFKSSWSQHSCPL